MITGGNFYKNYASDGGGGVIVAARTGSVTINGGKYENNKAEDGGVVYVDKDARLFMRGGVVVGNEASSAGGAFSVKENGALEVSHFRGWSRSAAGARLLSFDVYTVSNLV